MHALAMKCLWALLLALLCSSTNAFVPGASLAPRSPRRGLRAASCASGLRMMGDSVEQILARVKAMESGGQAPGRAAAPAPVPSSGSTSRDFQDVMARVAAMEAASELKFSKPITAPQVNQVKEDFASVMARVKAMESGGAPPAGAAAPRPAAPQGGESVADILARAAAMASGSVPPTHAGGNRHNAPAASAPPAYAPPSTLTVNRQAVEEDVSSILARAAAMAGSAPPPPPRATTPVPVSHSDAQSVLERVRAMEGGRGAPPPPAYTAPASGGAGAGGKSVGDSFADVMKRVAEMEMASVGMKVPPPAGQVQSLRSDVSDVMAKVRALEQTNTMTVERQRVEEDVSLVLARAAAMSGSAPPPAPPPAYAPPAPPAPPQAAAPPPYYAPPAPPAPPAAPKAAPPPAPPAAEEEKKEKKWKESFTAKREPIVWDNGETAADIIARVKKQYAHLNIW